MNRLWMVMAVLVACMMIGPVSAGIPELNGVQGALGTEYGSRLPHATLVRNAKMGADGVNASVRSANLPAPTTNTVRDKARDKVMYLTFDDGPSVLTEQVLDILDTEEVPATFFVLGKQAERSPELIRKVVQAGHALGNHTYNHEYDELYGNFTAFWNQVKQTEDVLYGITGLRTPLVRAPGGTYGHFDETYFSLLEKGGYTVFDWNVDSGDSKRKGVPAAEIIRNIKSSSLKDELILLLHDGTGHEETVKALPEIIRFYKNKGYEFKVMTPEQEPVQFAVSPSIKKKGRVIPSPTWIQEHIVPNAELFHPIPLLVEKGRSKVQFTAGEYELSNGSYYVPLRLAAERLGAKVNWNQHSRQAKVTWDEGHVLIDTRLGQAVSDVQGSFAKEWKEVSLQWHNQSLWVPLRMLLQDTGHRIDSVTFSRDIRLVKLQ